MKQIVEEYGAAILGIVVTSLIIICIFYRSYALDSVGLMPGLGKMFAPNIEQSAKGNESTALKEVLNEDIQLKVRDEKVIVNTDYMPLELFQGADNVRFVKFENAGDGVYQDGKLKFSRTGLINILVEGYNNTGGSAKKWCCLGVEE